MIDVASDALESSFERLLSSIPAFDEAASRAAYARQAELTKPAGALGQLEDISARLAGVFGEPTPDPRGAAVIVCVGDHEVTREGVSAYPSEVTPAMVNAFLSGHAAVNAIARSVNASVTILNVGVATTLAPHPSLVNAPVRLGARNIRVESAMTRSETLRAVLLGADVARSAVEGGADLLVAGEMGIGNTTPAAAVTARLLRLSPEAVTGRGTGIDDERWTRKVEVVEAALSRGASSADDPMEVLADLGGFEIAAMVGVMLQGAACRKAVILDGFVEGAAALVAARLAPNFQAFLFAAGLCAERGHRAQLNALTLSPMFDLGLRLGEGTGGALAVPLLRAAAATLREMRTFAEAGIPR
ncbi:nicotinate-nucleotide--dimethylbenzimidazole phosphoribosyltransferase [Deinococcus yavapaiensis]|uniref:nicotinate-nucleotide--dimethylbenzimidazole phosphoribosyltransferase n=1 Tax=Deinococcus yavapaiensis TaxID=309889 RepID=UPI001FE967C3|nr:nicotinate-nucleotide--dimethylbenzimidazole phosphoribosyltransferase [Deinococcus yavapaiensis]